MPGVVNLMAASLYLYQRQRGALCFIASGFDIPAGLESRDDRANESTLDINIRSNRPWGSLSEFSYLDAIRLDRNEAVRSSG